MAKKIRYVRQRDNYTCGPVAILNAIKWTGAAVSEKKLKKKIEKQCRCEPTHGTNPYNLDKALTKYWRSFHKIHYKSYATVYDIANHVENGGAVLTDVFYWNKKTRTWHGHWTLVTGVNKRGFKVINFWKDKTSAYVSWKTLKKWTENAKKTPAKNSNQWYLEKDETT